MEILVNTASARVTINNPKYDFIGTQKAGDITPMPTERREYRLGQPTDNMYHDKDAIGRYEIKSGHKLEFDVIVPAAIAEQAAAWKKVPAETRGWAKRNSPGLKQFPEHEDAKEAVLGNLRDSINKTLTDKLYRGAVSKVEQRDNGDMVAHVEITHSKENALVSNNLLMLFSQAKEERHKMDVTPGTEGFLHEANVLACHMDSGWRREIGTGLPASVEDLERMLNHAVKQGMKGTGVAAGR